MPFLTFLIFAQVRSVLMKVTDRHTDIHRNGQSHGYRQNRAVLPKNECKFQRKQQSTKHN